MAGIKLANGTAASAEMTVDTNGASIRMVYYDNTRGWLLENI